MAWKQKGNRKLVSWDANKCAFSSKHLLKTCLRLPIQANKTHNTQERLKGLEKLSAEAPLEVPGEPQYGQLCATWPPQSALRRQKHTNMITKDARTSFCIPQSTPKTGKSMHFAKDILKKSKMHLSCFHVRKKAHEASLKPSHGTSKRFARSFAGSGSGLRNGSRCRTTKIERGPPMP